MKHYVYRNILNAKKFISYELLPYKSLDGKH